MGLPQALALATIAALLRYVPYIGPLIALGLPSLLALAVFPGWIRPLALLGCVAAAEGIAFHALVTAPDLGFDYEGS